MPSQGSMLCPNCRKLISVDEERCPWCGTWRPGLWGWGPWLHRILSGHQSIVPVLVGTIVVLYALSLLLDLRGALSARGGILSILAPSTPALYLLGMTGGAASQLGHGYTVLTAIYLHGGLLHIFFNVLWLRQLGPFTESELGPARFFLLWTLSGAAGFVVSNLISGAPSIGASGSIFGLLGGMIAFRRRRGGGNDVLTQQFLQWAVILFLFGLFLRGVNNWAHAGGFVAGYLLGMRLHGVRERPPSRREQLGAAVLAVLTVGAFILSVVQVLPLFVASMRSSG